MRSFSLLILSLLIIHSCSPKESKYDDHYKSTLLLQLASTPSNANEVCVSVLKKQAECVAAPFVARGITVTPTSDESYASQCTGIRNSSLYNTMSLIAQTCVLTCQETDWKNKISTGECLTSTASSLVQSSLTNTVVKNCMRSCFQATNGVVPDADLTKLLILNLIQNGD
jgi:hypothetical protein